MREIYEDNDDIRCVLSVGTSAVNPAKTFCGTYALPLYSLLTTPDSDEILTPCRKASVLTDYSRPKAVFFDLSLPLFETDYRRAYGFLSKAALAAYEVAAARQSLNNIIKENLFPDFADKAIKERLFMMLLELSDCYAQNRVFTSTDGLLALLNDYTGVKADYAFVASSLIASVYRHALTLRAISFFPSRVTEQFARLNDFGYEGSLCLSEKRNAEFILPECGAELNQLCQTLNLISNECINLPLPFSPSELKDILILSNTLYPSNSLLNSLYLNGYLV